MPVTVERPSAPPTFIEASRGPQHNQLCCIRAKDQAPSFNIESWGAEQNSDSARPTLACVNLSPAELREWCEAALEMVREAEREERAIRYRNGL